MNDDEPGYLFPGPLSHLGHKGVQVEVVSPGGNLAVGEFEGGSGYTMRCSGFGRSLEACYLKSGELCPHGYKVVSQSTGTVAIPVGGSIMAAPQYSLTIECNPVQRTDG